MFWDVFWPTLTLFGLCVNLTSAVLAELARQRAVRGVARLEAEFDAACRRAQLAAAYEDVPEGPPASLTRAG